MKAHGSEGDPRHQGLHDMKCVVSHDREGRVLLNLSRPVTHLVLDVRSAVALANALADHAKRANRKRGGIIVPQRMAH